MFKANLNFSRDNRLNFNRQVKKMTLYLSNLLNLDKNIYQTNLKSKKQETSRHNYFSNSKRRTIIPRNWKNKLLI